MSTNILSKKNKICSMADSLFQFDIIFGDVWIFFILKYFCFSHYFALKTREFI